VVEDGLESGICMLCWATSWSEISRYWYKAEEQCGRQGSLDDPDFSWMMTWSEECGYWYKDRRARRI
jgi:hypothetical protein